jgi:hypothetical protein
MSVKGKRVLVALATLLVAAVLGTPTAQASLQEASRPPHPITPQTPTMSQRS